MQTPSIPDVVTIRPTYSAANHTNIVVAEEFEEEETLCETCGVVRGPITPEASALPRPMQAAFVIPDSCLNSNTKVTCYY